MNKDLAAEVGRIARGLEELAAVQKEQLGLAIDGLRRLADLWEGKAAECRKCGGKNVGEGEICGMCAL